MSDTIFNKAILKRTEADLIRSNKYFERELADTIKSEYKYDDGDVYFESVLNEMYQTGELRYKIAPTVKQDIYWYEDADGDPWYHEIPSSCTKSGHPSVVSCAFSPSRRDYTIEKTFI